MTKYDTRLTKFIFISFLTLLSFSAHADEGFDYVVTLTEDTIFCNAEIVNSYGFDRGVRVEYNVFSGETLVATKRELYNATELLSCRINGDVYDAGKIGLLRHRTGAMYVPGKVMLKRVKSGSFIVYIFDLDVVYAWERSTYSQYRTSDVTEKSYEESTGGEGNDERILWVNDRIMLVNEYSNIEFLVRGEGDLGGKFHAVRSKRKAKKLIKGMYFEYDREVTPVENVWRAGQELDLMLMD